VKALCHTLFNVEWAELPENSGDGICVHRIHGDSDHRALPRVGVAMPDGIAVLTQSRITAPALNDCRWYACHI
jgi:hypothetical protein